MDRTHFADESTLKHIATLENRVYVLSEALKEVKAIALFEINTPTPLQETAFRYLNKVANTALRKAGLGE